MRFSNFHTHCIYCDGEGSPEDYVKKAIEKGFEAIGFSSHAPVHFPCEWTLNEGNIYDYLGTINGLKEKYKGSIEIYLGLEIDYFSREYGPGSEVYKGLGLDYNIGSVHFIKCEDSGRYIEIDGTQDRYEEIIEIIFKGDTKRFVSDYYSRVRHMVKEHNPDIIGHLDLIKKNNRGNRYFSMEKDWYRDEVLRTIDAISRSHSILEVNTGGLSRGYTDALYPEPWILRECFRLGIPVVLNSDAHDPSNIDSCYEDAISVMRGAGYTWLSVLSNGSWARKDICM